MQYVPNHSSSRSNAQPHAGSDLRDSHETKGASSQVPRWARLAPATGQTFVMAMAVPNITGALHIGHALDLLLLDAIARHRAQRGDTLQFPPGTDHAGLAAQWAAERELAKTGQSRHTLGRVAFEAYMVDWKQTHERAILDQMRKLGIFAQYDRVVHSLDARRTELCEAAFRLMFERGWVYRAPALVNWCPRCGTCVGGQELERRECVQTLYRIPVTCAGHSLEIGTLHFELLLGATALGLSKNHPAFADVVGKSILVPVLGRSLPVVEVTENPRLSGYLTLVLPSYNVDDFERATKDGQVFPLLFDEQGVMAPEHHGFAGLRPIECHRLLESQLTAAHALSGREDYLQGEGYHRLCGSQVRPQPAKAWFLRSDAVSEPAREVLRSLGTTCNDPAWESKVRGALETLSGQHAGQASRWSEGACLALVQDFSSNRDWIISRQNWWGYRVPASNCEDCGFTQLSTQPASSSTSPTRCSRCGSGRWVEDLDVFDVLFHSGLWALLVGEDTNRNPHADCAVLGVDILEFWLPTAEVWATGLYGRRSIGRALVHGLICDEDGRKMSKSIGNTLDLAEVLERTRPDAIRAAIFGAMCGRDGAEQIPLSLSALSAGESAAARLYERLLTFRVAERSNPERSALVRDACERVDENLTALRVGAAYTAALDLYSLLDASEVELDRVDYLQALRAFYPFHPELCARVAAKRGIGAAT